MSQTLVLLHGWGLNAAVWETVLPQLSAHYNVETVNLPGFGGEPWQQAFVDIEQVADKVAADLKATNRQPIILAGWSMGGLVATVLALRHPQLVRRLHTIASSPYFVAEPENEAWPGIDRQVLHNFETQLGTDFKATVKRFLAVQAMGSPHARQDMKTLQSTVLSRPMATPQALAAGLEWLANVDLRPSLDQLAMPLHRAYGRLDSLVPVAVAEHISAGSEIIFQRSAHAPFLNQAEDFCNWLLSPGTTVE